MTAASHSHLPARASGQALSGHTQIANNTCQTMKIAPNQGVHHHEHNNT